MDPHLCNQALCGKHPPLWPAAQVPGHLMKPNQKNTARLRKTLGSLFGNSGDLTALSDC